MRPWPILAADAVVAVGLVWAWVLLARARRRFRRQDRLPMTFAIDDQPDWRWGRDLALAFNAVAITGLAGLFVAKSWFVDGSLSMLAFDALGGALLPVATWFWLSRVRGALARENFRLELD